MWVLGKALVTIAVLHTCAHAVDIRTFTKDWSTSRHNSSFKTADDLSRSDSKFVYAVCDNAQLPAQLECDVKIETMTESSSSDDAKVCHLTVTAKDNRELNELTEGVIWLELLGNDKVVIMGLENDRKDDEIGYLRINVLDMNKCSDKQLMFSYGQDGDITRSQVIVYAKTFDVVTTGTESCNGGESCRLTFDEEGKQISGPIPFPVNNTNLEVQPVEESSPKQGFYVIGFTVDPDRMFVTHLGIDDKKTRLMKVEHLHPLTTRTVTSNKHDSYGICWSKAFGDKEVHCTQFANGVDMARLNETLMFEQETTPMGVYNLPDGLLLVTMKSQRLKCDNFEVTKILSNGHKGSVKVDGLNLDCGIGELIVTAGVRDAGNEYCFNFVSEEEVNDGEKFIKRSMQYRSKCISKRDVDVL